jgi:protein TonB
MNSSGGGGAGAGGFGSKMNYLDMVRVKIENHKKYPDAAQQRNIEGQVTVEFTIQLDGRITEPSISKSSGYPSLDLAAIDAVKKASPFSSPPRDYFSDTIHINLPIRFELIR